MKSIGGSSSGPLHQAALRPYMAGSGGLTSAQKARIEENRQAALAQNKHPSPESESEASENNDQLPWEDDGYDSEERTRLSRDKGGIYGGSAIVSYHDLFASVGGSCCPTDMKQWLKALQTWATMVEAFDVTLNVGVASPPPKKARASPV